MDMARSQRVNTKNVNLTVTLLKFITEFNKRNLIILGVCNYFESSKISFINFTS